MSGVRRSQERYAGGADATLEFEVAPGLGPVVSGLGPSCAPQRSVRLTGGGRGRHADPYRHRGPSRGELLAWVGFGAGLVVIAGAAAALQAAALL